MAISLLLIKQFEKYNVLNRCESVNKWILYSMCNVFTEIKTTGAIRVHPVNEMLRRRKGLTWVSGIKLIVTVNCNYAIAL